MENSTILILDLSTTSTGYAVFDASTKRPVSWGALKPKVPGKSKKEYLERTMEAMLSLVEQITALIEQTQPSTIVIEEIAGSKNRLSQKTLDGFHWVLLYFLRNWFGRIEFYDVTGVDGWRKHLQLRLSDADKLHNKELKKLNKVLAPGQKLYKITPKHLAARHVEWRFGIVLDVDRNSSDNDIADALAIGDSYLSYRPKRGGL